MQREEGGRGGKGGCNKEAVSSHQTQLSDCPPLPLVEVPDRQTDRLIHQQTGRYIDRYTPSDRQRDRPIHTNRQAEK